LRVIGITGWSGAGKTTLLAKLIPLLISAGNRVSTLKHAHHAFDIDVPGKDSYLHRAAGATEVLVTSGQRYALMHELRGTDEPSLTQLLTMLSPVDLVLVEGFKAEHHRKIEVFRVVNGRSELHPHDPHFVAIATDAPQGSYRLPQAHLDDVAAIAALVLEHAEPLAMLLARLDPA
jgi:molybdopterin-guanine dinucleotide biosynthesis adapter protein